MHKLPLTAPMVSDLAFLQAKPYTRGRNRFVLHNGLFALTDCLSMKMTKSALYAELAEKCGKSRKEVAELMDALVEVAYRETKSHGEFSLPGLGKMVKKHREARQGRNPATGESIQIPAKTVLKFRVAKAAKEAIL